tara:strand:+ start:60067 stop:60819 length:753 start_codon:yes stop_codon:yes gene_type:complete
MTNNLILLRHGESIWNFENKFTGWTDVDLSKNGEEEAKKAGMLLKENDLKIDLAYTSFLKRSILTYKLCSNELNGKNIDVISDWRLNERHYGRLQGLNKLETSIKYGEEQVHIWRRSYNISPPKLTKNDKRHPKYDKLYKDIDPRNLPSGESLKDTLFRVKPLWINDILPLIKKGRNLIIVAHGNSLRAIVKILKNIDDDEIIKLNIPTGIPQVFEFSSKFEIVKNYYLGSEEKISRKTDFATNQASSKS